MENDVFGLIQNNDLDGLRKELIANPGLANEGVPLTLTGKSNPAKGHPLHRICDAVFAHKITDEQAIEIAKVFLGYGANIDGFMTNGDNNTPLIAAASLHAEKLGTFYIEHGANICYAPKSDGGTALHWAAFCGRDRLVDKLIKAGAHIDQLDTAYHGSPMGWAIHELTSDGSDNKHNQMECIKLLLSAGADKSLLGPDSIKHLQNIAQNDPELRSLLS
ncbi:MAG TPA: ankyrin repeat domain-containing protein [Mucilaginibacter sp.]|nr:ankyrin repeat domain-containing protein [Mucilaginibacter sp.]